MRTSLFLSLFLLSSSINPGPQSCGASLDGSWTGCNDTNVTSFGSLFSDNDGYELGEANWELEDISIDQKTAKSFLRDHRAVEWEYDSLAEGLSTTSVESVNGEPRLLRTKRRAPVYRVPSTWKISKVPRKTHWKFEQFPQLQRLSSRYNYFKYKWPPVKRSDNNGVGGWFMPKPGKFGYYWGALNTLWYAPDNWEIDCSETRRCEWSNTYKWHARHYKEGVALEYMALLYSWYWCTILKKNYWEPKRGFRYNMCPQPCLSNPCRYIQRADKCTQIGHFTNPSYQCSCQLGWLWDKTKSTCVDRNVCNTSHNRCNKAHTKKCHEGIGMDYRCECADGYLGKLCTDERNPCIEDGGHDACQPKGICVPAMRTRIYSCECVDGWSDQPEEGATQYPDCKKKDDPCEKVACMNGGHCEHSKNGQDVYCVCKELHVGDRCQYRRPHWSSWDKWGPCSVTCGAQGVRKRKRYCEDPTGLTDYDCSGKSEDEEVCRPAVCKYSGRWTSWGESTPCSVICGTGVRVRSRHCKYCKDADCVEETLLEAERGSPCDGISQEKSPCNTQPCPVPPGPPRPVPPSKPQPKWSAWGAWSSCSQTCGQALRRRTRERGKDTQDQSEECKVMPCPKVLPIKCTTWSTWGACDAHSKMCHRVRDSVKGEKCDGKTYQRSDCSKGQCLGKVKAEGYKEHLYREMKERNQKLSDEAAKQKMEALEKRLEQEQEQAEQQAEYSKFFSEEKGHFFGGSTTFIKGYENIGVGECARRCLEGYKDYNGRNPSCQSFNYRPADTAEEDKTAKCWLHKENKNTPSSTPSWLSWLRGSKSPEWSKWPHRYYYERKDPKSMPPAQKVHHQETKPVETKKTPDKGPAEITAMRFFSEEKGHFFGDGSTFIKAYENIGYGECARRCQEGYKDYDGRNPVCKSFNYRPADTAEKDKTSKCWLHKENKDTSSKKPEWSKWPHRYYYQRKSQQEQKKPVETKESPAENAALRVFSEEKGHFFGDGSTFIKAYENIGYGECARRCLEGYKDYDGRNPVCKSFNYRPADKEAKDKTAKCWLHKENKDTSSKKPEWSKWPHRYYYQRKSEQARQQEQKKPVETAENEAMRFFSEEKGHFFGDFSTFIKGYENIGYGECARRCLEGYKDYDGRNPVCKSFNYRPANSAETDKTAKCWLHKENKDTSSKKPQWSKWPHRYYYQRKEQKKGNEPAKSMPPTPTREGELLQKEKELAEKSREQTLKEEEKKKPVEAKKKPEKDPAEIIAMRFFSDEKGHYFGDGSTFVKAYENIGYGECARRCMQGYKDYDGRNPVCKSFNYRPADTAEKDKTAKCWLHKENKNTHSNSPEWSKWPHRYYYEKKEEKNGNAPAEKSTEAAQKKEELIQKEKELARKETEQARLEEKKKQPDETKKTPEKVPDQKKQNERVESTKPAQERKEELLQKEKKVAQISKELEQAQNTAMRSFSEEKGHYFGDRSTYVKGYANIDPGECARRCLEDVNPVCKSFNYRPANTAETDKLSKCWLHKENKNTHSNSPEWSKWPHRYYYERKDKIKESAQEREEKLLKKEKELAQEEMEQARHKEKKKPKGPAVFVFGAAPRGKPPSLVIFCVLVATILLLTSALL